MAHLGSFATAEETGCAATEGGSGAAADKLQYVDTRAVNYTLYLTAWGVAA